MEGEVYAVDKYFVYIWYKILISVNKLVFSLMGPYTVGLSFELNRFT